MGSKKSTFSAKHFDKESFRLIFQWSYSHAKSATWKHRLVINIFRSLLISEVSQSRKIDFKVVSVSMKDNKLKR